jgi:serine protease Do
MRTKIVNSLIIFITLFIGIGGTLVYTYYFPLKTKEITTIKEVVVEENDRIKTAIDKIYDAVVLLESYQGTRLIGSGTGFIYKLDNERGYIMTNHHVVDGATTINATLSNGEQVAVTVLGSDEFADLAVLAIRKEAVLQVAEIATTDNLEIGDTVFTVGSPLGKQYIGTVTKGILSGKNRTVEVSLTNGDFIMEVLQTDAAINPGNSGGPLLNINGQVIGVNSLKVVKDEIEGMGFAIPIEIAMGAVDRLEKGEKIERPMIGLKLINVTDKYSLYLSSITIPSSITEGVVIAEIENDKPASLAGLLKSDVIIEINGQKTKDVAHFRYNLYKYKIGDTITIKYLRGDEVKEAKVLLNKSL